MRARRPRHLHLPVCAATTGSPGAIPIPYSTPSPHREHLGVLLRGDRSHSFDLRTVLKLLTPGAHSRISDCREVTPSIPKRKGCPWPLPAAANTPTPQAGVIVGPPAFPTFCSLHPGTGLASRAAPRREHAPKGKSGPQKPLPEIKQELSLALGIQPGRTALHL